MGYFVCEYTGKCGGGDTWTIGPNFKPRKAEFGSKLKGLQESGGSQEGGDGSEQQGVNGLPEEKRLELREKLNHGRGDMTLQEWDDFLADLVDWGVITKNERLHANGLLGLIPTGGSIFSLLPQDYERFGSNPSAWTQNGLTFENKLIDDLWTGDPVKFLQGMDSYILRWAAGGNMLNAVSEDREVLRKVEQILQEILW